MGRLRAVALVSFILAASSVAVAPPAPAAVARPVTAFVWDGSEGGSPGYGRDDTFVDGQDGVTLTVTGTASGVTAHFDSTDAGRNMRYAEVRFFAPRGSKLVPGTYENATRAELSPPDGQPGMSAMSDNAGCNQLSGRFVVEDAAYDPVSGAVQSFAATFQQDCELHPPTLFGEVRFRSSVPFTARKGGPTAVPLMSPAPGMAVDHTITLVSSGTSPLHTGQEALGGDPAGFTVTDDHCSQQTLSPGQSCTMTVRYGGGDDTARTATLTLPDDSARGARRWTLNGAVSDGPPPPVSPDPSAEPVAPSSAVFVDRSQMNTGRMVHTFHDGDEGVTITVGGTALGAYAGVRWADLVDHRATQDVQLMLDPAKGGDRLEAGRDYIGAVRARYEEGAQPGVSTDLGCNTSSGSFSIFDIGFDGTGQINRLAAAWINGCTPGGPVEAGEIRWHSTVPLASHTVDADRTYLNYSVGPSDQLTRQTVTVTSEGTGPLAIGPAEIDGDDADSFAVAADRCAGASLPPGASCTVTVDYTPTAGGTQQAALVIPDDTAFGGLLFSLSGIVYPGTDLGDPGAGAAAAGRTTGYWMVGADGAVYAFGDARPYGNAPVGSATAVDLEPTPSGLGYWVVDDQGRVYPFGDATAHGNVDRSKLAKGEKATSLSATPSGGGYWIFTDRGRVLTFGDAVSYGDVSNLALAGPVLDSIVTPTGRGYYMVASDGGIFAFGDAKFYGSMGGRKLNAPVQSLVPDSDGVGYWLVASDGGIFAFQAGFKGSMGATRLNRPVTGMVRSGTGYLMVGEDGGIFDFSGTPGGFLGSLGAHPPTRPITSVAVLDE